MVTATAHQQLTEWCCCRYVSCFCTYIHLLLSRTLSVISFNLFRSFRQDLLTKISYSASLSLSGSSLVLGVVGEGGGTPSNGLCGEAPPGRGTNFRRQVYERVGTSLGTYKVYTYLSIMKRLGNPSFRSVKRPKRCIRCILWLWKSRETSSGLQQFKGMQSSKLGRWTATGYHLSLEGIQKGYLIYQKWY